MSIVNEISMNVQIGKSKIVKGLVQQAIDEGVAPEVILVDGLLSAMDIVGEKFKNNEIYVPEVLVAARAMNMGMGMPPQMNMGMPMGYGMPNVNIQPAQFQNFAQGQGEMVSAESIGLIKDVPLEVTVELGRTSKSISDILEFAPGTIIELDKIAGEPIDILVNGKFVAKGEVVVIEESFGVRIMEIVK